MPPVQSQSVRDENGLQCCSHALRSHLTFDKAGTNQNEKANCQCNTIKYINKIITRMETLSKMILVNLDKQMKEVHAHLFVTSDAI